jgi:hypothetical protein
MHEAQGKPALAIRKWDGEILRMLRDVARNPSPADGAVFAKNVVVIYRHRKATMARFSGKARPRANAIQLVLLDRLPK